LNSGSNTWTEAIGVANPFVSIEVGLYAAPTFADLNGDGKLDFVVGNFDGKIKVFFNSSDRSMSEKLRRRRSPI
jgi:hypothetical protein